MTASSLSFTILGTGAIGGFYGSRLLAGGATVRFIAHSDVEHIRQHGLQVDSTLGDHLYAPVEVYSNEDEIPASDVVCVALKTTRNDQLPQLLRPLVRPGTIILNLQNGLTMEEDIARAFPEARVIGVMCFVCSNKVGPGHVAHLDYGTLSMAAHDVADAGLLPGIRDAFVAGGIEVEILPSLLQARWRKLAWNIPFNGLSVLLDAETDVLISDPDARATAQMLMDEVARGSAACGYPLEPQFLERMISMTEEMKPYAPSMRLDYLSGRELEIEFMYRRPVREAKRHGVQMPVAEAIAHQLTFRDRRNRGV